ncbi:MAG: response regulator [Sideroxyarcus sp.]|nr:response regulator [Sideroxyarcus sp.]
MLKERLLHLSQTAAEPLDELWSVTSGDALLNAQAGEIEPLLDRCIELMLGIGSAAAEDNMLDGVQSVSARGIENLLVLKREKRTLTSTEAGLVSTLAELLLGYVISEGDAAAGEMLVQHLMQSGWPLPLNEADAAALRFMLMEVPAMNSAAGMPAAPAAAESPSVAEPLPPMELQKVDGEMLSMLGKEFARMDDQLLGDLTAIVDPQLDPDGRRVALDNFAELLERLAVAARSIEMTALGAVFSRLVYTLPPFASEIKPEQHALLMQLPARIADYLAAPQNEVAASALAGLLADTVWRTPVDADALLQWIYALVNVEIVAGEKQHTERQERAEAADVSLTLPDDINQELLDGLLQELPVQTSAFTSAIERLAAGEGNAKDVERAMRAAHTLKGAANTVGVRGIANLTHHIEDILAALSEADAMPDRALANLLINAGDCLEAMSEALMGVGSAPEQALEVLQEVLDCANRIDHDGVFAAMTAPAAARHEPEAQTQRIVPQEKPEPLHQDKPDMLPQQGNVLRVPAPVVDELLRLAGETLISNSQIQERLRTTAQQSGEIKRQLQSFQQLVAELEHLVDVRGVAAPEQDMRGKGDFDPLEFEHFSELHTVTRRLVEAANDAQQMQTQVNEQLHTLGDLLEVQQRLHMDSQHAVIRTRLVPVSSVVSRLQRSVRQTARLLDKQVTLEIKGDNTSIDSNVLNELMDPLMHVLRNAVDHGIEASGVRAALGKPATGNIELSFARTGNSIVVRCKDDGAGLDYAAIRRIAESKGMLVEPEHEPSPDELARLILVNGFSTRDDTTQVSGRGVGMNVVYSRMLDMKGSLALNSERGAGLSVELRLPATLLSAHTLVVRHCGKLVAVSSHGVEDIHYITADQIEQVGAQQIYRAGDNVHALVRLETLLDLPADRREADRLGFPVLLTRADNGVAKGVLVQEVLSGQEVVLKNFGRYVPKINGTVGAVILGDGTVAPVVDLVELLRTPAQRLQRKPLAFARAQDAAEEDSPGTLTALVVDDSLSARRAASAVMQDAGYRVRTAIDGLEAVNMLQKFVPSVMLVDMEMPRMNGIELTAHVRDSARTKNVPVIMITSRSTEKHRKMCTDAGVNVYLTKPYNDDVLIEHVQRLVHR